MIRFYAHVPATTGPAADGEQSAALKALDMLAQLLLAVWPLTLLGLIIGAIVVAHRLGWRPSVGARLRDHLPNLAAGRRSVSLTDLSQESGLSSEKELHEHVQTDSTREAQTIAIGRYVDAASVRRLKSEPGYGKVVVATKDLPVLVIGAAGSGKTSGIGIPAILEWGHAPVLATSVKADIAVETIRLRQKLGDVSVFDPANSPMPQELRACRRMWTPLAAAHTWPDAVRTAGVMVDAANPGDSDANSDFWRSQTKALIAVLMYCATREPGTTMWTVMEQLGKVMTTGSDVPAYKQILDSLLAKVQTTVSAGDNSDRALAAINELRAALLTATPIAEYSRGAAQTIGGVVASALTTLHVFSVSFECGQVPWDDPHLINPRDFLSDANTLYVIAPPTDQKIYAPLFTALIDQVISEAYLVANEHSGRLQTPLLLDLDELANIAPLPRIDEYVSTGRSHGIVPLLLVQDLSQLDHRFGEHKRSTILSNAGTVVLCPGTKDTRTLELLSTLLGEEKRTTISKATTSGSGASHADQAQSRTSSESTTTTSGHEYRPVASPARLASMQDREAIAIVSWKRTQLIQRRYFESPHLQHLWAGDTGYLGVERVVVADVAAYDNDFQLNDL